MPLRVDAPVELLRVADASVEAVRVDEAVVADEAVRVVETVCVRVVDAAGASVRTDACLGDANWRALLTSVPA